MCWKANLYTLFSTPFNSLPTPQTKAGCTLRGLHCKRCLVPHGRSSAYKLSRNESSPPGSETVEASVQRPDCSFCNRQHNGGLIHKQARGYEVRLSLCSSMETPVLVPSKQNYSEGETHPRLLECDSGQTFPAQSSDSNRVVPIAAGVQSLVLHMGPTPSGFVCDLVQSQTTEVCFPSAGSDSLGSRCLESAVGSVGGLRLSPSLSDPPGDLKIAGSVLSQHDPHCPRMAKHALVLGPSGSVGSDSLQASISYKNRNLTNFNLHAWLLESLPSRNTGSLMKWQHKWKLLREAQPEQYISQSGSTRMRWTSGRPLKIRLQIFYYIFSKKEICNQVLLRAIEQPLLTWWAITTWTSVWMKISPAF